MSKNNSSGFFSRLNPRERILLLLMFGVFSGLFLFVFTLTISSQLTETEAKIEGYRQALAFMNENKSDFLKKSGEKKEVDILVSDELNLITFLDLYAQKSGIKISSFKENKIGQSKKNPKKVKGKNVVEEEVIIEIQSTTYSQFIQFLGGVEGDDQNVYVKRIHIAPQMRRRENLKISMTVCVYKLEKG